MIRKLTIEKVYRTNKDKNGVALVSKNNNKPYEKVSIITKEMGDQWVNGFGGRWNSNWKQGDVVEVEVETKEVNGKTYYNFKQVDEITQIKGRIEALEKVVFGNKEVPTPDDNTPDADEIPDIPF